MKNAPQPRVLPLLGSRGRLGCLVVTRRSLRQRTLVRWVNPVFLLEPSENRNRELFGCVGSHKPVGPIRPSRHNTVDSGARFRHDGVDVHPLNVAAAGNRRERKSSRKMFKLRHYVCHEHADREGGVELQER